MNNDYSVAQAAIDSIRNIDKVCCEANINITNALIDNYTKDIEMRIYGEQFIQEGSWLDKTDDESIIKTIFLALPRFVRHLITLIKRRWQDMKMAQINAEEIAKQEELLAEKEAAEKEKEQAQKDYEAALEEQRFIDTFWDTVPNVRLNKKENQFEYLSDVRDYEDLVQYYTGMAAYFKSYEEAARDYTGALNVFSTLRYSGKAYVERNIFSDKNNIPYRMDKGFMKTIDYISDVQKTTTSAIDASMRNVNKWYSESMTRKQKKLSNGEIEIVNRIMDDVRKIRDDFAEFDDRTFRSIVSAKDSFIYLDKRIKEYQKYTGDKKKRQLFEEE